MAQEGSDSSVTSSSANSWWQEIHHVSNMPQNVPNMRWTGSTVSRYPQMAQLPQQHCEGDVLVSHPATSTLTSSGLTVDSANPPIETHLWSQVLLSTGVGARGMHQQNHEDSANFLDLLNSKTIAPEMFDLQACDYLKKIDTAAANTSWEFPSTSSISVNPLANYTTNPTPNPNPTEPGLGHLSDLVNNWSIAPPSTNLNIVAPPNQCNTTICPSKAGNNYLDSSHISHMKDENPNSSSYSNNALISNVGVNYQDFNSPVSSFLRSCQLGMNNNPVLGLNNKLCSGLMEAPWCNNNGTRSLSDIISFSGSLNKPTIDLKGLKTCVSSDTAESRKSRPNSPARTNSRGSGTSSDGKKKRCEETSEAAQAKKSKQETSTTSSSPKQVQAPKVNMAEKITALQQIVSPFGKTDTASVLLEAINYIKFLHEQVQLLSDPYLKAGGNKDYNAWEAMEREEKSEASQDLKSRGLCLVPVSCTPQVYRDSNIPDYWTPPYRSCLFR